MNHSTSIFAALVIAFIIYITVRGQLGAYLQVLGI
jgi:hypothetical protein